MKKKVLAFFVVAVMILGLVGCGAPAVSTPPVDGSDATTGSYKASFITSTPRGNEFIDLIWSGFLTLEEEGWEVKCIETFETAEQAEQVRAMCAEGYDLIYTQGDDVMKTVLDMQDELTELYPDTYFFFLDTYAETTMPNSTAVTIDPFETCFIAGYVAALQSESGVVGLMLPLDTPIMQRFEYGYYAGADYANKGTEILKAYTNDWVDTTKGYESTKAHAQSNPDMDIMIQAAYISGYGVIQACADMELPCIGVDDWQTDVDPIVFWSAIKSMNVAVTETAKWWTEGMDFPFALEFDLNDGGYAYEDIDLKNLSEENAELVSDLKDGIIAGEIDVFAGEYDSWRNTDFSQAS